MFIVSPPGDFCARGDWMFSVSLSGDFCVRADRIFMTCPPSNCGGSGGDACSVDVEAWLLVLNARDLIYDILVYS